MLLHRLTPYRAALIHHFLETDLTVKLFELLRDDTEPITPSQTTLLKLIDADLSSPTSWLYTGTTSATSYPFLISIFNDLSRYCLVSIQSGQDDARLPKVFEGLILTAEALSSIGLNAQEREDRSEEPLPALTEVLEMTKSVNRGIVKSTVGESRNRQMPS